LQGRLHYGVRLYGEQAGMDDVNGTDVDASDATLIEAVR
jgi:hypothetical protein